METELFQGLLDGFSVFESLLILALLKCLGEIRRLYQGHIKEKDKILQNLKTELQQTRYTLAEIRSCLYGQPQPDRPEVRRVFAGKPKTPSAQKDYGG